MRLEIESDEALLMIGMIHRQLSGMYTNEKSFLLASLLLDKLRREIDKDAEVPIPLRRLTRSRPH